MLWIILTLAAAILWASMNIIDKHVITDELKYPKLASTIAIFMGGIIFILSGLLHLSELNFSTKLLSIIAGIINGVAIYFYYRALTKEEVSRISPVISLRVILVIIAAFFIFKEVLTLSKYVGSALILVGVSLVSVRFIKKKFGIGFALVLMLIATIGFASRDIIFKSVTENPLMSILFWVGIGNLIFSGTMLAFFHPRIKKRWKNGIKHVFLSGALSGFGLLCFISAIAIASVSLVNALVSIYPMLVFLMVIGLSYFKTGIIRERLDKKTLFIKSVGITLTILGAIIVALF